MGLYISGVKRIIIADDHAVVRTGLQLILEETANLSITGECSSGEELLYKLSKDHDCYDMVILDIHMPGRDSIEVLKEIRSSYRDLPVVIFTMNNDDSFMIKMFQNGASAFISKDLPPEIILDTLQKVFEKKRYLTNEQASKIAEITIEGNDGLPRPEKLSPREYQLLREIASGASYDEIAHRLNLSKNTISNHRMRILRKLNLKNNSDLTRFAYKMGILQ